VRAFATTIFFRSRFVLVRRWQLPSSTRSRSPSSPACRQQHAVACCAHFRARFGGITNIRGLLYLVAGSFAADVAILLFSGVEHEGRLLAAASNTRVNAR